MRFHYTASDKAGRIIKDEIEAQGIAEALEILAGKGLKPLNVKAVKESSTMKKRWFWGGINETDKIFLTRYLGMMLKTGTDLLRAIDVLINDFDKPILKEFLNEVHHNLEKGQPFHTSFSSYPQFFDPVFVNLIKAGEVSGNLDKILEDLSVSLNKKQEIKSRLRAMLVYPAFLLVVSFGILFFLVTFAVPKIANVFESSGFQPPLFSRIVFAVGKVFGAYALYIGGGILAAVFAVFYLYKHSLIFRRFVFGFINHLPIIRGILIKIALQRFAATLSSLIKAGLPLSRGIEITAEAVGHEGVKTALLRISKEGISRGVTVSEAFRRETIFPRLVVNLIAISEEAGHIENVLGTLGDFYATETDTALKFMVSLLEPLLLMIMGVIVGVIALSIIVPVYQLTGNF